MFSKPLFFKDEESCLKFSIFKLRWRHYGIFEVTVENQARPKLAFSMAKTAFEAMYEG